MSNLGGIGCPERETPASGQFWRGQRVLIGQEHPGRTKAGWFPKWIDRKLVEFPQSDDLTIITESAVRTGFNIPSVMAVYDARFKVMDA